MNNIKSKTSYLTLIKGKIRGKIISGIQTIPGVIIALTILGSGTFTTLGIIYNFINSKVIWIQIGCLIMIMLGWWLISFEVMKQSVRQSTIIQALGLFIGISAVATLFGLDPWFSLFGHFERGTGFLFTVTTGLAAFFTVLLLRQRGQVRRYLVWPIALLGGILGMLTWLGISGWNIVDSIYLGASSGGGATMGNSSFAGTVLLIGFFISIYLLATSSRSNGRWLALVTAFFSLVNPVLVSLPSFKPLAGKVLGIVGDARGATLAVFAGLVVMASIYLLYSSRVWVRRAMYGILGLIFVSLLAGVVLLVVPGTRVHRYFIATSGEARFLYWNMSVQQIAQHPLLGTGPETFRYAHQTFYNPKLAVIGEPWADKPHNVYLEIALTTGLIGLVVYLGIFVSIAVRFARLILLRKQRTLVAVGSGLLIAYMVNNIILFDTMTSTFLFMIVIVWIASETEWEGIYAYANDSVYSKASSEKKIVNMITWPFLIRSVTVIMISVAGFWWVRGEVVKLNMAWNELFSKPPIRTELYKKGEDASPYGAGISFAQRADDYGQVYLSKQSNIKNQREREIILQDIEAIVATLDYDLKRYPPNMQSYQALGNLAVSYLEIMQSAQQGRLESVLGVQSEHKTYWLNRLEEAHDRLKQMAPLNPRVTFFERKLDELR